MNETTIIAVANAITANAEVLKSLIDHLSSEQKQAVEAKVGKKAKDTPVTAPTATPEPVAAAPMPAAPFPTAQVAAPVVAAPVVPTQAPAPIPTAPVMAAQAPVAPAPVSASPFNDQQGLMTWMMTQYQAMGPQKGARIQECLTALGVKSVGEVQPAQYAQLVQLVEALKAST